MPQSTSARRAPRRTPAELRERMPRRTPAETRELMLRAAVDVIRERALDTGDEVLASALAHVRLTQVAERATTIVRDETGDQKAKAITTGAIYQQWPTQTDFQVDLLFHIADIQATLVPGLTESISWFRKARADGVPLEKLLLKTMEEVHLHYREDPMYRVELSFLIGACDSRLRAALTHRQDAFYASVDQVYAVLLDAYGLRIKNPYTVRDLSRVIAAQIAGSVVIWHQDPALLDDPLGEENSSLMSRAILAIFNWMTEQDPARSSVNFARGDASGG